jgi:hypothetical protein
MRRVVLVLPSSFSCACFDRGIFAPRPLQFLDCSLIVAFDGGELKFGEGH